MQDSIRNGRGAVGMLRLGRVPAPDPGVARHAPETDVEALRRRLAEVEAASQARASFLATMSHEIREPINGVVGMARLLRDTALDEEQRGYVDALIGSAEALLTIINDVLDLGRIDAGKLELMPVDIELAAFLDRLRAQIEPRAKQKQLDFRCELLPGSPTIVHVDAGRLRQILMNLLGNALKFTEAGYIGLRVGPTGAPSGRVGLHFEVEDTGSGIPEAALDKLFTSFAQAKAETPRLFGGSGLGLMIAQRLARAMGGTITVDSRVGIGTTFRVELALPAPTLSEADAPTTATSIAGAALLLVDPHARTRAAMAEIARSCGLFVRTALSGAQALSLLHEAADRGMPFDLVMLDRSLTDPTPEAIAAAVRADLRMQHAKLVLVVSSGIRGDAAAAKAAGFAAYLSQPVTAETLLECLHALHAAPGPADHLVTVHSLSERRPTSLRLLLADDNPVNCKLASIILERAGHTVDVVHDGAAAVRALRTGNYDLVLMDVEMPVMGGIEAATQIRAMADRRRAAIPIIAVTANAMRGDDAACLAAGMNGYVTKPISAGKLLGAINKCTSSGCRDHAEVSWSQQPLA